MCVAGVFFFPDVLTCSSQGTRLGVNSSGTCQVVYLAFLGAYML